MPCDLVKCLLVINLPPLAITCCNMRQILCIIGMACQTLCCINGQAIHSYWEKGHLMRRHFNISNIWTAYVDSQMQLAIIRNQRNVKRNSTFSSLMVSKCSICSLHPHVF